MLTWRRRSAVALAGLAGAELRVYQLRVDCDTLPDGQAVVCSFSVPAALVPAAQGCVATLRRALVLTG